MPFDIPDPTGAIEKVMDKAGEDLKEKDRVAFEKLLNDVLAEGKSPKESLKISPRYMESLYAYAYNFFTHGKFKDSLLLMRFLMDIDQENPRYPLACGAAYQQMKDYEMAAGYYLVAFHLDQQDPIPLYYMYECFKNQNDMYSAMMMLNSIVTIAADRPEHAVLKERVERTRQTLVEQFLEEQEKKKDTQTNET